MIRALTLAALALALATTVACGQKGPLRIPEPPAPNPAAP
jgi:predicted small lipoprotein YifL